MCDSSTVKTCVSIYNIEIIFRLVLLKNINLHICIASFILFT